MTRLRVLVAVAQHGSVTAAARCSNYAQPSVSHHLARLEAETGARLTQRAGRGIRLTDAGRLLAGRAEEILGRLDAAERELAAHVGQREERIRLAVFPSALGTIVPAAAGPAGRRTPRASTCCWPRPSRQRRCGCSGPGRSTSRWSSGITQNGTVSPPAAADRTGPG